MSATYRQLPVAEELPVAELLCPSCWKHPWFLAVCRSPQNAKEWHGAAPDPLQRDSADSWTCKCARACTCFSSYTTQPNIRCFTLHLRTWLLLKTQLMCYTVRNLSLLGRDCALVIHLLMHPGVYSPSWTASLSDSMEGAISHPQFYAPQDEKAFGSIGAYKLG